MLTKFWDAWTQDTDEQNKALCPHHIMLVRSIIRIQRQKLK